MDNLKQKWQEALAALRLSLSPATFKTWIKNIRLIQIEEDAIILGCPNPYTKEWLEKRYQARLEESLLQKTGRSIRLEFKVAPQLNAPFHNDGPLFAHPTLPSPGLSLRAENNLNPYYSFQNFIVGPSNNLAHAAALAVAEKPGKAYNPFFIYGGVGVGKTHLMHAVGNALCKKRKQAQILYTTSESFTNDLIESFRKNKSDLFRKKYRQLDVLIIDDIQFISGKEAIQEEIFHTFNALHSQSKQIIISSDCPPQELEKLEDRLRSRFEGGLIIDIQPPDFETRSAILLAKCEERNLSVAPEVLSFIAENVTENIRQLEGVLTQLITIANFSHQSPTLEMVSSLVSKNQKGKREKKLTPKIILEKLSSFYRVSIPEIKGKSRRAEVVFPRQVIMYFLRKELGIQLENIGIMLGDRDHTTIIHGVSKIETLVNQKNARLLGEIREIRSYLQND